MDCFSYTHFLSETLNMSYIPWGLQTSFSALSSMFVITVYLLQDPHSSMLFLCQSGLTKVMYQQACVTIDIVRRESRQIFPF